MKPYSSRQRIEKSHSARFRGDLNLPFGKTEGLLLLLLVTVVINMDGWLNHHPLVWRTLIHHSSRSK